MHAYVFIYLVGNFPIFLICLCVFAYCIYACENFSLSTDLATYLYKYTYANRNTRARIQAHTIIHTYIRIYALTYINDCAITCDKIGDDFEVSTMYKTYISPEISQRNFIVDVICGIIYLARAYTLWHRFES